MTFSIEELATLIGIGVEAARKRAQRQAWRYTETVCRGGKKRLYAASDLPADVRNAIATHHARHSQAHPLNTQNQFHPHNPQETHHVLGNHGQEQWAGAAGGHGAQAEAVGRVSVAAGLGAYPASICTMEGRLATDGNPARSAEYGAASLSPCTSLQVQQPGGTGGLSANAPLYTGGATPQNHIADASNMVNQPQSATPTPSAVRARVMLPADIGHPIRAAMPLAALTQSVPAATGTGGVTNDALPSYALTVSAMKDREILVGMIMDTKQGDNAARHELALKRYEMIAPIKNGQIVTRFEVERHAKSLGTTAGTLYRYLRQYKQGGVQALAPAQRKDKGEARTYLGAEIDKTILESRVTKAKLAEITAAMIKVVRGLWAQNTRESSNQVSLLAAAHLHHLLIAAGMPEGAARLLCKQKWALPRRFVEAEQQYSIIALADRDSKGFYDLVCTSVSRTRAQLEPGDVIFGDVSPCDIPIRRPDGTQAWARLIAWRDAASNWMHITGYLAEKGEGVRREHVALSFANMCEHSPWGLPKRLYLDNGSEYNWMEMLNAWQRLTTFTGAAFGGTWLESGLDPVGKIWRTEPYKPRAKLIESGFSQLLWCMSWHPCFADSDRMTKKTRALGKPIEATDQADVAKFVAESVQFYNSMPQGGQHMQGRSPADMIAEFQARGYRRVAIDSDALALSFAETDSRRAHAGQVQFGGWTYYAPQLLAYDDVDVNVSWARHTPDAAYVFDKRTHQFIAAALPMPVFGFSDVEGAKTAKRLAAQARKVVDVMRGQCAWIEPRDLMNDFAQMSGISLVLDEAKRGERRIEIDAHGRAMVEARNAAVLAAIARADATVLEPDMVRMNDGETAEEAEARRMFG